MHLCAAAFIESTRPYLETRMRILLATALLLAASLWAAAQVTGTGTAGTTTGVGAGTGNAATIGTQGTPRNHWHGSQRGYDLARSGGQHHRAGRRNHDRNRRKRHDRDTN